MSATTIHVTKRNGNKEPFNADKINKSIERACSGLPEWLSKVTQIATETQLTLYDGITEDELDQATINAALQTPNTNQVKALPKDYMENPFASPFVSGPKKGFEGVNQPIKGGYFAGYHNGKKNIVGKKLFVSV